VTIRFVFEAGEAVRSARFVNRRIYRLMLVAPAVLLVGGLVVGVLVGWADAALPIVVALCLFGFSAVTPALSTWQVRRRYPDVFNEETVLTIDGVGLHATKGAAASQVGWAGITDSIENDEFIVIRRGRRPVAIVPKRAFSDAAEQEAFRSILTSHVATEAAAGS
jgi:YcxB-like protein